MDENFEDALRRFFKKEWEYKQGSADDFIYEFQDFLEKEKFDLTNVNKYK